MKFSHFFIDRPIFATVISVFIVFVGLIAFSQLSLTQYPNIAPPTITVSGSYSGASPEVIMNTTLAPLEQKLNGVEGMIYMSSEATSEGSWSISITFETGVDIDMAQVLVQNRVRQAENRLPQEVRDVGLNVYKRNPDILLTINLVSPNGTRDKIYLSNYAITQMQDRLARIYGVSEFSVWGAKEYSMRIWLNPDRLAAVNLSPIEVIDALKEQNTQVAAGRLNQPPSDTGAAFELLINARGRLETPDEFGDIIVKYTPDGRIIHLKDIARIELGAYSYSNESYINQKSSVSMGVYQLPGTNAIETVKRLRAELEEMKKSFPDDVDYIIGYDTTEYVQESINALYRTIFEAVILVVLVIIVFLQNWRAAMIPLFAIPVSLIGTFAMMYASGFTINNLTLFGLVLAIGIVVDDAIVVVENVERNMKAGLDAREATKRAMSQIQGALIAIVLVLSSAFLPTAFLPGISGQFYRQFAMTISTSTIISGLVSLTLTPALCALFMRHSTHKSKSIFDYCWDYSIGLILKYFNLGFDKFAEFYGKFVKFVVRISLIMLILYCGMIWATKEIFVETPTGFIPKQDRGSFNAWLRLPDGGSFERTEEAVIRAGKLLSDIEGIRYAVTTSGQGGSSVGRINFRLSDRKERDKNGWSLDYIMDKVKKVLDREILEATINVTTPATVPGIGSGSDFKLQVQDRVGLGVFELEKYTNQLIEQINALPAVSDAYTTYTTNNPQLYATIDRERAQKLNVSIDSIFKTLQFNLGSVYVNDFNILGRVYRVVAQAEAGNRKDIDDIYKLKVPNDLGQNVPLGSVVSIRRGIGPYKIIRYNLYPSAEIQGNLNHGYSTGYVMGEIEKLAAKILPQGMGIEWTDLAYQQKKAGNSSIYIFAVCVIFVFLLLSALYESWTLPLSVILVVPLVILFAMIGVNIRGLDNNLMTQIGFVVLIGLACKNAILIVEFAKQREDHGEEIVSAVSTAAKNRLRPIVMTSLAFILGVAPLAYGTGSGFELRQSLGTSVMFGMIGVTIFGCVFTPVFYYVIRKLFASKKKAPAEA
ncbi:MAG TPA: multidrug efflux RND transporter permease subunit [Candidatus Merdousia gallistercoris]|nr:multidrug efflux RND transporter permease subunit [Candidatus Merdousia gallistercoris]